MDSIKTLYKIGNGPSSSHTMAPYLASLTYIKEHPDIDEFIVELYGSLASTGKNHLTDKALKSAFKNKKLKIKYSPQISCFHHPNAMKFISVKDGRKENEEVMFSVGGGDILKEGEEEKKTKPVYPHKYLGDILKYCLAEKITFLDYVLRFEEGDIMTFAETILKKMFSVVESGFAKSGVLPGKLKVKRKAGSFYREYLKAKDTSTLVFASALSVSEENAAGEEVVTSPTCGAAGIIPGCFYPLHINGVSFKDLSSALLVAGLVGNVVRTTGSISGAEVGCQGEVGVACAMAAAGLTYLKGGNLHQIEYASEIALEHHLGLTCDPVLGYVQIPCIERNAMAARRAIACSEFSLLTNGMHYISFDDAVKTMVATGRDINVKYRETAKGGLASIK